MVGESILAAVRQTQIEPGVRTKYQSHVSCKLIYGLPQSMAIDNTLRVREVPSFLIVYDSKLKLSFTRCLKMSVKLAAFWILAVCLATSTVAELICDKMTGQCAERGLNFDEQTCSDAQIQVMKASAEQLIPYIGAAKHDLHGNDPTVFEMFFYPEDRPVVSKALDTLEKILRGQSVAVNFTCGVQSWDTCEEGKFATTLAQPNSEASLNGVNDIWLCPRWFSETDVFDPCLKPHALMWTDQIMVMLHELLHLPYLSDWRFPGIYDPVAPPKLTPSIKLRLKLEAGPPTERRPIYSVSNWQWYIRAAWAKYIQSSRCKNKYTAYNQIAIIAKYWQRYARENQDEDDQEDKDELRKLLSISGDTSDADIDKYELDDSLEEDNRTVTEVNF